MSDVYVVRNPFFRLALWYCRKFHRKPGTRWELEPCTTGYQAERCTKCGVDYFPEPK